MTDSNATGSTTEELAARVEALQKYARECSIALMRHSGGGSEMFKRIGDEFYADPDACSARIQSKFDTAFERARSARLTAGEE